MRFSHILSLTSFASVAVAAPFWPWFDIGDGRDSNKDKNDKDCDNPATTTVAIPVPTVTAPAVAVPVIGNPAVTTPATLPSTGSTDLPAPAAGLTLKYIAVGHGLQNYTCTNTTATPVAIGALAVLYDITSLSSTATFANASSTALWNQALPLTLANPSAAGPITATSPPPQDELTYQAFVPAPFPNPPLALFLPTDAGTSTSVPFLGIHYFDASGVPTFDLSAAVPRLFFAGAKTGNVKAPATADKGLLATGAVDWLQLGDNGKGLSSGLSQVYRVVTAGGSAQACSVSGATPAGQVFSVPYAAQYWYYG